jgi:hypothetical protein
MAAAARAVADPDDRQEGHSFSAHPAGPNSRISINSRLLFQGRMIYFARR